MQFDKNNSEGELEEEKERNRELNESIEQLTLELYNKVMLSIKTLIHSRIEK